MPIITKINIIPEAEHAILPSKVSNKWPAIILAARRTARVRGRIIRLIDSMITIRGIKAPGVFSGTKWAILKLNCLKSLINIYPNQSGKLKDKVILKCLVEVNT